MPAPPRRRAQAPDGTTEAPPEQAPLADVRPGGAWDSPPRRLTSNTSSSRIRVPNTMMPSVSIRGWSLRSRNLVAFFLQSRIKVTFFLWTLSAILCHLRRDRQRLVTQSPSAGAWGHAEGPSLRRHGAEPLRAEPLQSDPRRTTRHRGCPPPLPASDDSSQTRSAHREALNTGSETWTGLASGHGQGSTWVQPYVTA